MHGWPPRVADFFSFVLWAPCLPHLITALGREGFKVAEQSEWVSSDREAQKSTEGAEPGSHMVPSMICSRGRKLFKTRLLLRLALKKQHWERGEAGSRYFRSTKPRTEFGKKVPSLLDGCGWCPIISHFKSHYNQTHGLKNSQARLLSFSDASLSSKAVSHSFHFH